MFVLFFCVKLADYCNTKTMNIIKKIYYPEIFLGRNKSKNYFEGWYFKNIDKSASNALAVIAGVSICGGDSHAFVQTLDGREHKTNYIRYGLNEFKFNENKFEIQIGKNYFSADQMNIEIDAQSLCMRGALTFENIISFPKTALRPGIMGPFSFIPFMECYHGIVNIQHNIKGSVITCDKTVDYTNGSGYIEKDWGRSFPKQWIWIEANNFNNTDATLMFSIAKIPWLGMSFKGFISFLRIGDDIYYFATYTNAKIKRLNIDNGHADIIIHDKDYIFEISAENSSRGGLTAPENGSMKREITESLSASVSVRLTDRRRGVIFNDCSKSAGMETACDNSLCKG